MKTIMLATDGSPSAAQATATAIELAQATGAPLHVVTAWSIPISAFGYGPVAAVAEVGDAEREKAQEALDRAVAQAEEAGLAVTSSLREGLPVEEICHAASELDASLVVLGAHGWGALRRLVSGSVSTGVLRHAPCPVLVVRSAADDAEAAPAAAAQERA